MFALKRVAPLAVRTSKTPLMALCAAQGRFFSSFEAVSRGAAKLGKALEKEIKYENDNYTQLEDIETYLNDSGFQFTESDNGIEMTLTKQVGDKKITVKFESRMPTPDEEQPEDQENQPEDEDQGMSENYVDFTILVTDNSGRKGLIVEATSMDTEINYNSIMVSENVQEHASIHRFERQMRTYAGPEFSTLDERIQSSLVEYLEGFGVNEHMCAFIEVMSLDKDQRLYMQWLNQLKDFTQV